MSKLKGNERNWSSLLVAEISKYVIDNKNNLQFTRAESENSLRVGNKTLFPDMILFNNTSILMGWELKLPDTPIDDTEFIKNAYKKAKALGVNSFLLWNFSYATLYQIQENDEPKILKTWDDLKHITTRDEALKDLTISYKMLHSILNEINLYAQGKDLVESPIVDLLSESELLEYIIIESKPLVDESLKIAKISNQKFRNDVTNWWLTEKDNHEKGTNEYNVLSLYVVLSVMNKILFAHILKHSFPKIKYLLENLNDEKQQVFDTISTTYNFMTVFESHLGESFISNDSWDMLNQFNTFLFSCELDQYTAQNGEEFLTSIVMRHKRKMHGQYSTPKWLAQLLVLITVDDYTKPLLDPCCGTGTIAKAGIDIKRTITDDISLAFDSVWSADKFSYPLQITSLALTDPTQIQSSYHIIKQDIFEWNTTLPKTFKDPHTGNTISKPIPKFGTICSNLPFVRQEQKQDVKSAKDIIQKYTPDLSMSAKSDLYAFIPFSCWELLDSNGKLGIIISNSWLGTSFGIEFYNLLLRFYKLEKIVTSSGKRWFHNADVITNILIMTKRDPVITDYNDIKDEEIQFITIGNVEQKSIDELQTILASLDIDSTDKLLTHQSYSLEQIGKYTKSISMNTLFSDISWLDDILAKTIPLDQKFNIGRGERRGFNDLFYPRQPNKIEKEYLVPLVKNIKKSGYVATINGQAFATTDPYSNLKSGAKSWVDSFSQKTNGKGDLFKNVLKRGSLDWFQMKTNTTADIITSINLDKRLFFARCPQRYFVDQRLIYLRKKNNDCDLILESALLNSSIGIFFIEALGFPRGLKVLDLNADKFKNYPILDSKLFTTDQKDKIKQLYTIIENRAVLDIPEELQSQDREELDKYILESLELSKFYNSIVDSLLFLYNIRQQNEKSSS